MKDGKWIYVSGRDLVDMRHGVPFLRDLANRPGITEEEAWHLAYGPSDPTDPPTYPSHPFVRARAKLRNSLPPGEEDR